VGGNTSTVEDLATNRWHEILACNGLTGFDDLWNLDHVWVQPPNTRHRGFGGVARHELALPEGGRSAFYFKIHRNRRVRTLTRPWRGTPALARELANHRHCAEAGVASPTPLYCASRRSHGELRGILVTEALHGFRPLRDLLEHWRTDGGPNAFERRGLIEAVAAQLCALHAAGLVARSYTPNHVFVRLGDPLRSGDRAGAGIDVRLIDLERIKHTPRRRAARVRDLVTLRLTAPQLRSSERLRFFEHYLGVDALTPEARRLWQRVAVACEAKRQRRDRARALRAQSSSNGR